MRRFVLATALVLATAVPAFAQPSLTPLSDPEQPPAAPRPAQPAEPAQLSEGTATALAIGTTLGGFALAAASDSLRSAPLGALGAVAIFVGPSAGHIYAGEGLHATGMTALRLTGAVVFIYGMIQATTVVEALGPGSSNSSTRDNGVPLAVLGAATYVGATLYDLYDAHRAVRRTNHERAMIVAPLVSGQTAGLALAGSF